MHGVTSHALRTSAALLPPTSWDSLGSGSTRQTGQSEYQTRWGGGGGVKRPVRDWNLQPGLRPPRGMWRGASIDRRRALLLTHRPRPRPRPVSRWSLWGRQPILPHSRTRQPQPALYLR